MRRRAFIAGTAVLLVSPSGSRAQGLAVGLAFSLQVTGAGKPSIKPSLRASAPVRFCAGRAR